LLTTASIDKFLRSPVKLSGVMPERGGKGYESSAADKRAGFTALHCIGKVLTMEK